MTTEAVEAALCLPPLPMSRALRERLPDGSVDCHLHVFRDGAPLATPRSYTPQMMTLADWRAFAEAAGIARGVLVQPSVYGFDNQVMLEALAETPGQLRGIAVIDPETPDAELERLHAGGVRGVRCNTRNLGGLGFDLATTLARRVAPLGWSLQFQVLSEQVDALAELAPTLGLPVVLDHLGFIDVEPPDVALGRLRALLDAGDSYVKLSAPYRVGSAFGAPAVATITKGLAASHPERLLWGTDWPHTELWSNMPDDADLIDDLLALLGDGELRRQIFVETPNRLFFQS